MKNKFLHEYDVEKTTDSSGKKIEKVRYLGEYYYYQQDPSRVRKSLIFFLILAVITTAAFLTSLWRYTELQNRPWFMVPFLASIIPSLYMLLILITLMRRTEPMEHFDASYASERFPLASFFGTLLSGIALIAGSAIMATDPEVIPDSATLQVIITAGIMTGCFLIQFLRRKDLTITTALREQ